MSLSMCEYAVRGFSSTVDALSALEACRARGIECRLVQLPPSLAREAECGTALRSLPTDEGRVEECLATAGIQARVRSSIRDFA